MRRINGTTVEGLPLWGSLSSFLPTPPADVTFTGPRRWWGGPLDVEGLALGSVGAFASALAAFTPEAQSMQISFDAGAVAASFGSFGHLRIDGAQRAGFAPLSGFHRTADGWVRVHANYPHHERALFDAFGASTAESVVSRISDGSGDEIEAVITDHGGIAAAVRDPQEWLASESAQALAKVPWIRWTHETAGQASPRLLPSEDRPLHGVRVLDLTRVIAGPSASRLLGALGADVLRLDPPAIPELWDHHVDTGFDKRSAVADLNDRATRNATHELLSQADAVLLGYRLAGLARFGFDESSLRDAHPHLAVVSLDAWGTEGPFADRRGFDSIVQAATGIAHLYGSVKGETWRPGALPVQALDHATGLGMGAAVLMLLSARKNGLSGSAHLSLARTALELLQATPPSTPPSGLPAVTLRSSPSPHGRLDYVAPPLNLNGIQLEYKTVPQAYGSASLTWNN